MINQEKKYNLIKFEDGDFSLDVKVSPDEETVWLTQKEMALLFDVTTDNIGLHIKNIIFENELDASTTEESSVVQIEGNRKVIRKLKIYNLDMIISVGYRVKSKRGIIFRKWANKILKQYLLKGYAINEERCLSCAYSIISLQNKVEKIESKIKNIEDDIYLEKSKAFFEGEIIEPYTFIRHIFFLAKKDLVITDYYADNYLISLLKDIKIKITIITSSNSYLNKVNIPSNINIVHNNDLHGRYIFIDDK